MLVLLKRSTFLPLIVGMSVLYDLTRGKLMKVLVDCDVGQKHYDDNQ